jgi:oligopeptide/dipeptide ABC transporter ATP-binding protein
VTDTPVLVADAKPRAAEDLLLVVRGLRTSFFTFEGEVHAVNGVDLEIHRGQVLGLVGESGAGKSTVAWSIMNLVPPPGRVVGGQVTYREHDLLHEPDDQLREIRGKDLALIVPNARNQLNPLIGVGAQLANAYRAHKPDASQREAFKQAVAMMAAVGIPDPQRRAYAYPHELSGGMAQRIVIGMALMHSPTLLIADEATFGLDVTIQAQVLETFRRLIAERHAASLIITRDLGIIAHYCDRAAVMYGGEIVEQADVGALFADPLHPYTQTLLAAVRYYDVERVGFDAASASTSFDALRPPPGCYFYERCPKRLDVCRIDHPALRAVRPGHQVRCHLYDDQPVPHA